MKKLTMGILAHVDAGKTTLSEAMLYQSGVIRKLGRVDYKDAYLDTYEMERDRGITIFSKQAVFSLGDLQVTLLDTPGHVDFSAEMERPLQVLDAAVQEFAQTMRIRMAEEQKELKQKQKMWALRKPVLDAHISSLQKRFRELEQEIDGLAWEKITCFRL